MFFNSLSHQVASHQVTKGSQIFLITCHLSLVTCIMQYELLFLVGHDKEANLESIEKEIEKFVGEIKGDLSADRWESKRKLAYPIKHQDRGVYVARRFTLPEYDMWGEDAEEQGVDRIEKLSRALRLYREVLRFSIVRSEDLEDLNTFTNRKSEERKTHHQKVAEKELKAKKPAPRTPIAKPSSTPVSQAPQKEAPKKEISTAEINERLDEILNV